METIEVFRNLQLSHRASRLNQSSHSVQSQNVNLPDNLGELAYSMAKHETVPIRESDSRSHHAATHSSREPHPQARQNIPRHVFDPDISMVPESPTDSRDSSQYITPSDMETSQLSSNMSTANQDAREFAVQPPASELPVPPSERESTRRRRKGNATSSSPDSQYRETSRSVNVQPKHVRRESDVLAVELTSSVIHLGPSPRFTYLDSYIETQTGYSYIAVALSEDIDQNLISQDYAARCGIQVRPLNEGEEDICVEFGDNQRRKCIGVATLQWKPGNRDYRGFLVHCLVVEHGEYRLVFGKLFRRDGEL
jgi:hypothetical protein